MDEKLIIEQPENFEADEQTALYNFYRVLPFGVMAIVYLVFKFLGMFFR